MRQLRRLTRPQAASQVTAGIPEKFGRSEGRALTRPSDHVPRVARGEPSKDELSDGRSRAARAVRARLRCSPQALREREPFARPRRIRPVRHGRILKPVLRYSAGRAKAVAVAGEPSWLQPWPNREATKVCRRLHPAARDGRVSQPPPPRGIPRLFRVGFCHNRVNGGCRLRGSSPTGPWICRYA